MRKFGKFLYAVLIVLVVAGCSSTPKTEPGAAVEERAPGPAQPVETPGVTTVTPEKMEGTTLPELTDPKSILSKRSVYFDFDRYDIKDEFKPLVEAHAKFLVSHPKIKMLIQGNADERGSREYNLALGQKRADAVKRALALLGGREDQIESVSLGKEKPKNPGHDEAAWAENRRGDMLYTGEF
jgi:peptidoglycan-associated lipoprotein